MLLLLASTAGFGQSPSSFTLCHDLLERIPEPGTEGLEEPVREHLHELAARAGSVVEAGSDGPSLAAVVGDLALAYHAYGLVDAAGAAYGSARCFAPGDPRWSYGQARIAEGAGELSRAEELYFEALGGGGELPVRFRLAEIAMTRGDLARAELLYRQALDEPPSRNAALAALGQIALSRGENQRAVELLEAALAAVPEANRLHYPLSIAYRRLGDRVKAGEHLEQHGPVGVAPGDPLDQALEAIPRGARISLLRGRSALRAGRPADALPHLESAVATDPANTSARVALAVAASQLGDSERARTELETVLAQDPDNPTALFNLALLALHAGERDRARDLLERAVAADPGDEEARRMLESLGLKG